MITKIQNLSKDTKKMNVLYVEDDPVALEVISEFLEELFAKVVLAKDGQEAFEYYKNNEDIDIVISDVHMPHMDGLELAKQLKSYNNDLYIIMLTQYNEVEKFIEGMLLQVDAYVLKPINFDDLLKALEKIVRKKNFK